MFTVESLHNFVRSNKLISIFVLMGFFVIIYILLFSSGALHFGPSQELYVRVRIEHNAANVHISSKKFYYRLIDLTDDKVLQKEGRYLEADILSDNDKGIDIGDIRVNSNKIRITPLKGGILIVNGVSYKGDIDIFNTENGLDVINTLQIEDYLKGVVPCEVSHLWPSSALRAQAIVCRSFVLSRMLKNKDKEYDVTDTTYSQVYKGKSSEKWRTSRAVDDTRGKVLARNGEVIPAYFHSCCGGHTQDAKELWQEENDSLRGVKCPWCRWSPYFRWQSRVPAATIIKKLNDAGYDIKRIDNIKPGPRSDSDRVLYVKIRSGNKWFEIKTSAFAGAIGRRVIKSSNFRVKKYPFFYYFSGYGWGHGVGMCQWGALGLSLRWWSTERILKYYYPGSEIVDIKEVDHQK